MRIARISVITFVAAFLFWGSLAPPVRGDHWIRHKTSVTLAAAVDGEDPDSELEGSVRNHTHREDQSA